MRFALSLVVAVVGCVVGCAGQLGTGFGGGAPIASPTAPPSTSPRANATATMSASVSFSLDIKFYGVPLGGANDLVFVLDRSGSMSGGKLEEAKQQLSHVIEQLPDGTRVGLVFFNARIAEWTYANLVGSQTADAARVATNNKAVQLVAGFGATVATRQTGNDRRLVELSPSYRHYALRFIRSIAPAGSTAAVPALRAAGTMGARHIVFLSDGIANTGGGAEELLALGRVYAQQGIRVDTIGLGHDQDYGVLQELSMMTGGIATIH